MLLIPAVSLKHWTCTELLTEMAKLSKDRLSTTVYKANLRTEICLWYQSELKLIPLVASVASMNNLASGSFLETKQAMIL